MKNRFSIFVISVSCLMCSCASVPKESIELSARLDCQLLALQDANAALITQVYADKEANMTEYLDSVWFPRYLEKLFMNEATQRLWDVAVNSENPTDRMAVMSLITKEALNRYKDEKDFVMMPIAIERDSVLSAFADEFSKARLMNDACGRLLESQYNVRSAYYSLLPDGKAERLDSIVNTSITRLDTRLRQLKNGASVINDAVTTFKDSVITQY